MINLEFYERLLASIPEIERKGKSMPYTSVNGNMFTFLDKEGYVGLRMSAEDKEEFVEKYNSEPMIQHEREMKEYVKVPFGQIKSLNEMLPWLQKSYAYAKALKPKATKRKK